MDANTVKTEENRNKNKKIIILLILLLLLLLCAVLTVILYLRKPKEVTATVPVSGVPTVTIETPGKKNVKDREEFVLAVSVNTLKEDIYPAASFSITFDPSKLEFMGLEEGNIVIPDETSSSKQNLPEWTVNVERSNEIGQINIMYLDMTAGEHAFLQDLLQESENVLFGLKFRMRGGVRSGDILDVTFEDAIFACSDETKSLAMSRNTLQTINATIMIGETE